MKTHKIIAPLLIIYQIIATSSSLSDFTTITAPRPTPSRIYETRNYKGAHDLTQKLLSSPSTNKTVAVIGGGLSGLSAAFHLSPSHSVTLYEARKVLGGKTSAWKLDSGRMVETGLHIFFGAYPNMMDLFRTLKIEDRLKWTSHKMAFALKDGGTTDFDFPPGVPAPLNMAAAILGNTEMLSLVDKIKMVPGLLPMILRGQEFIDECDDLTVDEFMDKYSMPQSVKREIFIAMSKALDFIDPEKLSMSVILTAMNRFILESDGSQTAFLDGGQPERLCAPMVDEIERQGGKVVTGVYVKKINTSPSGEVSSLSMSDGTEVEADYYVSAVPVDIFKKLTPPSWSSVPFFRQVRALQGVPVINLQIWFDRRISCVAGGLCFSRSELLSVYADMSTCTPEFYDEDRSMLSLVFAPVNTEYSSGTGRDWMKASDEEILEATLGELSKLFPGEIGGENGAKVIESAVVRVPRSVYAAVKGRNRFRPTQATPISNFVLAGDWTRQKYLGSMEGAIFAGKLAAEVVLKGGIVGHADEEALEGDWCNFGSGMFGVGCSGDVDDAIAWGGGKIL